MKTTKTVLSTIILLMALIQNPLFYFYTSGFSTMILLVPYAVTGLILSIWLLRIVLINRSTNKPYHIASLTIAMILGSLILKPQVMEHFDWKFRRSERNKIVEEVKNGNLKPEIGRCKLPDDTFFPLSNGGNDININKNKNGVASIEFYTDRGFLDHYSAILYPNDFNEVKGLDRTIAERTSQLYVKKLDNNWYLIGY